MGMGGAHRRPDIFPPGALDPRVIRCAAEGATRASSPAGSSARTSSYRFFFFKRYFSITRAFVRRSVRCLLQLVDVIVFQLNPKILEYPNAFSLFFGSSSADAREIKKIARK